MVEPLTSRNPPVTSIVTSPPLDVKFFTGTKLVAVCTVRSWPAVMWLPITKVPAVIAIAPATRLGAESTQPVWVVTMPAVDVTEIPAPVEVSVLSSVTLLRAVIVIAVPAVRGASTDVTGPLAAVIAIPARFDVSGSSTVNVSGLVIAIAPLATTGTSRFTTVAAVSVTPAAAPSPVPTTTLGPSVTEEVVLDRPSVPVSALTETVPGATPSTSSVVLAATVTLSRP